MKKYIFTNGGLKLEKTPENKKEIVEVNSSNIEVISYSIGLFQTTITRRNNIAISIVKSII